MSPWWRRGKGPRVLREVCIIDTMDHTLSPKRRLKPKRGEKDLSVGFVRVFVQ